MFTIYPPTNNVLDSKFVKVINVNFDEYLMDLMSSVPLKKKKKKTPSSKQPAGNLKHQQCHKDVVYTTGQCLIGKDNRGVSCVYACAKTFY
jgi:hypothetical protein